MDSDPLALAEQLDRVSRDPSFDLLAREAPRNRVIMTVDFDMIVEASPADPPFSVDIALRRQGLSAGRSISSNNCRRVQPTRRSTRRSFKSVRSAKIDALTSARL